ncbi:MAG: class II fructose-bisphosphate aldolase [Spirochaetes bacterium]|nr:class II fructose-bisphosphate aldolase [Spirochaetota bacterium]
MNLVPISTLLSDARSRHYAVGGFNVFNLEMLDPIIRAAEEEKTPVVVQVYTGDLETVDGEYISQMTKIAAKRLSVPLSLQLDHGSSYDLAMKCIGWGFSSVMIDLSRTSIEDNIEDTKRLAQDAHSDGISVEAELGEIYSGKDPVTVQKSHLTNIDLAARFVEETGVDALAVSIGTAHGVYTYGPDIDFGLLTRLSDRIAVPLVVHGGSYVPESDMLRMITTGVAKVNIGTELLNAFFGGLKEAVQNDVGDVVGDDHGRAVIRHAQDKVEQLVRAKIRLLNTYRTK